MSVQYSAASGACHTAPSPQTSPTLATHVGPLRIFKARNSRRQFHQVVHLVSTKVARFETTPLLKPFVCERLLPVAPGISFAIHFVDAKRNDQSAKFTLPK